MLGGVWAPGSGIFFQDWWTLVGIGQYQRHTRRSQTSVFCMHRSGTKLSSYRIVLVPNCPGPNCPRTDLSRTELSSTELSGPHNILLNENKSILLALYHLYVNMQKYELRFYLLIHFQLSKFRVLLGHYIFLCKNRLLYVQ